MRNRLIKNQELCEQSDAIHSLNNILEGILAGSVSTHRDEGPSEFALERPFPFHYHPHYSTGNFCFTKEVLSAGVGQSILVNPRFSHLAKTWKTNNST